MLPYRDNVGACIFGPDRHVLVARRADIAEAWQLPQGGLEAGESPRSAVLREVAEELGTDRVEVLGEHPDWLTYDLPAPLIGVALGGRYRGQRQKFFALRFTGDAADIRLDAHQPPEFDAWRWIPLADLPSITVAFRQPIYTILARDFARYA
jgi:putative (di)nucleoside polyphosphate hydrolase